MFRFSNARKTIMKRFILLVFSLVLAVAQSALAASAVAVPEAERWSRWLIPMPKEIEIEQQIELPAAAIKITPVGDSHPALRAAVEQLRSAIPAGADDSEEPVQLEIVLGVATAGGKLGSLDIADIARLARLPNKEQAYLIRPLSEGRLVLTALDMPGVYYAAQTLRQLLEANRESNDNTLNVPLPVVTDWPDLAERGLWGGSANRDIEWMARHKMNLVESHVSLELDPQGGGLVTIAPELLERSRANALNFVPVITHLNGLQRTGIYEAYPELKGRGDEASHPAHTHLIAPCCSQPKLVEVFADWMCSMAEHRGVTDVCAWLSELRGQRCQCSKCLESGISQYALEARCLVRAYRLAQKQYPDLKLRILLTQGSYATNDQVLAEVPRDIGITYYDGGRTYDSSREPMIYPLLEQYAADGGWLGCYPQLIPAWRIVCPWTAPQFVKFRMTEFVDDKLKCLCGYAPPDNRLVEFNILAAAEWSWNARGRDERQFALAWATRRGLGDVDAAADWAVTLGPVSWDVYGSEVPYPAFFGRASALIRRGGKPQLGEGVVRYFPSVEHIDADLEACEKSLAIAQRLDEPLLVAETEAIWGYVRMLRAIHDLALERAASKKPDYAARLRMQKVLAELSIAGVETNQALKRWEAACRDDDGLSVGGQRFRDTLDVTDRTLVEIARRLEPLGIRNPLGPYLREAIGQWKTEDFDQQAEITKVFDVSDYVGEPGTYEVGFKYTSGWNGLRIERVALVRASEESGASDRVELSVDEHDGSAAVRNRANVYAVELKQYHPKAHYQIVADIRGVPSQGRPPQRQGCNGEVWIKGRWPTEWRSRVESARPLTDEELQQQ